MNIGNILQAGQSVVQQSINENLIMQNINYSPVCHISIKSATRAIRPYSKLPPYFYPLVPMLRHEFTLIPANAGTQKAPFSGLCVPKFPPGPADVYRCIARVSGYACGNAWSKYGFPGSFSLSSPYRLAHRPRRWLII